VNVRHVANGGPAAVCISSGSVESKQLLHVWMIDEAQSPPPGILPRLPGLPELRLRLGRPAHCLARRPPESGPNARACAVRSLPRACTPTSPPWPMPVTLQRYPPRDHQFVATRGESRIWPRRGTRSPNDVIACVAAAQGARFSANRLISGAASKPVVPTGGAC
jgi:hypothetical protein